MYTLRNKRNIAHKGDIDPNIYDLQFLHHGAQWIMAELLRYSADQAGSRLTMEEAGGLISMVQAPIGALVEDHAGRRLVLPDLTACDELLVLLHDAYPRPLSLAQLKDYMRRRDQTTVTKCSRKLWKAKLIDGDSKEYRLTSRGVQEFAAIVRRQRS
jgi:hypothetical protein